MPIVAVQLFRDEFARLDPGLSSRKMSCRPWTGCSGQAQQRRQTRSLRANELETSRLERTSCKLGGETSGCARERLKCSAVLAGVRLTSADQLPSWAQVEILPRGFQQVTGAPASSSARTTMEPPMEGAVEGPSRPSSAHDEPLSCRAERQMGRSCGRHSGCHRDKRHCSSVRLTSLLPLLLTIGFLGPNHIVASSGAPGDSSSDHFSPSAQASDTTTRPQDRLQLDSFSNRQQQRRHALASSIFDSLLGSSSDSSETSSTASTTPGLAASSHSSGARFTSGANHDQNAAYRIGQLSDKVTLPGDILLGGLFPIHMKGTKVECGQINRDRGIQRLEAMLYALDRINADQHLLPDIQLGAILLDTCSSSTYALNQSLEFIRASINTVESSAFECKDKSTPRPKYGSKMIAGVIGGSYSEVSLQVANLLRLFRIPQVSYASTGTALSDKTLYDLFARTVPSDMFQARAIADIVNKLAWSYVSLVSSEGLYGDSGSKEFIKQASNRRICIATHEKISPTIGDASYDLIVQNLVKRNATGVVLFTRAEDTRELLMAVQRAKLEHNFAWVAADGWGTHQKLVEGVEKVAWGAITVELQAKAIPGFDQYMKELTPWGNARNPWFSEYWQEWFDCQLQANLLQQQRLASGASAFTRRSALMSAAAAAGPEASEKQRDTSGVDALRGRRSPAIDQSLSNATKISQADAIGQPVVNAAISQHRARRATNFGLAAPDEEVKQFCSPNLRISESNGYRQEQKVQFVVDAVYAMAHALHKAWSHLCDAQPGVVCEALKELNGGEFYTKYLLNVSFKDLAGSEVKFDEHGDGLGRYNIYNFRQVRQQQQQQPTTQPNDSIGGEVELLGSGVGGPGNVQTIDKLGGGARYQAASGGGVADVAAPSAILEHIYTSNVEFEYSSVGRWTEDEYNLAIDEIQFLQGDHNIPESYCSRPCELGQAKMMRAGDHCCWICKTCQPYEYLPDEFNCQDCGIGRWPVANKTSCFDLPQKYLRWDSVYSIISLCVACLGIALTLFVTIIFVKYIDTPVVKASGRELSFILLTGVAICHLTTFILLSKPTFIVCAGQRFLVNFGFALMYGSLLVKTNRISRIFNCARKSAKRPSFISPKSQMLITGILVGIQIFLTIVWFVFEPPGIRADSPEGKRDEVILKCRTKGRSFILSLVYNMILITTCTVYAVKTRKIPENFNESKFIGFTMYTTIVIWLAFVTMFFGTNNSYEIQMNTMCVCISLSAYVTLFCLFSPKISIILLHPDKNVRKLTMNSATYKRAFKPVSSIASVDGRNNLPPSGGSQPDPASGGPVSTTSNVLNLDTQTIRLQESSVVSNVANSNSAASNSSQKTPTNLSQQLALVGICSNCGAHQLTATAINSATNVASCLGSMASTRENKRQTLSSNFKGPTGVASSKGTSARVHHHQSQQQQQQLVQADAAGPQHQVNDKSSQNLVSGSCLASSRLLDQTMTNAKVLHNRIVTAGETSGRSSALRQPMATTKRAQTDDSVKVDLDQHHHSAVGGQCAMNAAGSSYSQTSFHEGIGQSSNQQRQQQQQQQQHRQQKHPDANRRHMGSLNKLNEMTSFTSSDRNCIDESISSLVNDSFMNTSLENTPCNGANGHISSSGAHRHLADCKGSDSMLYNQSLQSIDYCSDCCPSLCHCSCPICSSTANEGAIFENNGADQDAAHLLHAHRHNSISVSGTHATADQQEETCEPGADYDVMCILQLVNHADFQEAEANNNDLSSSMEASDEQPLAGARCRKTQEAPAAISVARAHSHAHKNGPDDDEHDDECLSGAQLCAPHQQKQLTETASHAGQNQAMLMQTFSSSSSGDPAKLRQSTSVVSGSGRAGGDGTSAKSSSNRSSRKRSSSSEQPGNQSVVYSALQAAAASALGAATSQIARSASISNRQHQLESSSQSGNSEQLNSSAIYRARDSSGSQRNRRSRSSRSEAESQMNQSGGSGGGVAGTIRASLELVKSGEARRRSIEASNRQRRKSGCFNYHDDYEYSYGLVHSDSESERERFFDENQADSSLDIGFGLKHEREPRLGANIAESIRCAMLVADGATDDSDDDDDFEHDGRLTLERHLSSRQPAQQTTGAGLDSRRQTSLRRQKPHQSSMSSTSKRRNKELELDEHRINSVALIAATLSAGGAIVESGGAASSLTGGAEQSPSAAVNTSDKSAASTSGGKAQGQPISEQQSMNKQPSASGGVGSQAGATYLGTF